MTRLWGYVVAYPYAVMFVLTLVEGPVAMVTSGMLVATGVMAFILALLLVVVADVAADSVYFFAGRLARHGAADGRVNRLLARMGATAERRARLEASVQRRLARVLLGAKVFDTAAIPVIAAAGGSGIPFRRFLGWNLAFTVPKATLLLLVGVLVGERVRPYLNPANGVLLLAGGLGLWLALLAVRRAWAGRRPG